MPGFGTRLRMNADGGVALIRRVNRSFPIWHFNGQSVALKQSLQRQGEYGGVGSLFLPMTATATLFLRTVPTLDPQK